MVTGLEVSHLLHMGVVGEKKWAVQPELAMAYKGVVGGLVTWAHCCILVGAGGGD